MGSTARPTESPREQPAALAWLKPLLDRRVLRHIGDYDRHVQNAASGARLGDFLLSVNEPAPNPRDVFHRLHWGGVFVFASTEARPTAELARRFAESGFDLEAGPTFARKPILGVPLPLISPKLHYFVARRTRLVPPGEITDRFTYDVRLVDRGGGRMAVLKEVPSVESIVARLHAKFPDVPPETLERRACKFTEKIFPTFLTREAGTLKVLEERMPAAYARRVPRVLAMEKDERGFVRRLWMNWLRNGGRTISQMEFAHQSADLLRVVHDVARIIHLDLRLDNFVITEHGVGFVDFGSAVRDGEDLSKNPLLATLFGELMRTSQIQRMLSEMTHSGRVTSEIIRQSQHKVDKAADFFYLALQFNAPHSNPELADLIEYDPQSPDARNLARLTELILRPADPANPAFRSARDILHGIERIRLKLDRKAPQASEQRK